MKTEPTEKERACIAVMKPGERLAAREIFERIGIPYRGGAGSRLFQRQLLRMIKKGLLERAGLKDDNHRFACAFRLKGTKPCP